MARTSLLSKTLELSTCHINAALYASKDTLQPTPWQFGANAVVSYEPEPTNFYCLCHFAESAQRDGKAIEVVQAAVSDQEGELPFTQ
jgi:hypothetical protein